MQIQIKGNSKGWPVYDKKMIRSAVRYYLEALDVTAEYLKDVVLTITFTKDLAHALADVGWDDDPDIPKKFSIRLNEKTSKSRSLKALAHECVHISQYIKGHLKDGYAKHVVWKKKKYDWHGTQPCKKYYFAPWEIEANGLMEYLYYDWKTTIRT